MKASRLLSILIGVVMLGFFACVHCPPKDTVIVVQTPIGSMEALIPKGHLNEKNEGETWITLEKYNEFMDKQMKEQERKIPET